MEFNSKLNNIKIGEKNSDEQENEIKNITNPYDAQDEVIKFYKNYSTMISNAGYDATHRKGLKISTPKQMLLKLPIAHAQVKENLLNENVLNKIVQIKYFLYRAKEITKIVHDNIMNSIKL